jgi:hypothetical protein
MSSRLHALLKLAALTDSLAAPATGGLPFASNEPTDGWVTRCLHCRSKIGVTATGKPWPGTTLEHVVPRAWFGKRAGLPLYADLSSPDDPRNLALACARCNHGKGRGADASGPSDARAFQIVERLKAARLARWRELPTAAADD